MKLTKVFSILTISSMLIASSLTAYSVETSTIPLNTIVDENTEQQNSYYKKNLKEKEVPEIIEKTNTTNYPVVTVWLNQKANVYSKMNKYSKLYSLYEGTKLSVEQINEKWGRILSTSNYVLMKDISYNEVPLNMNLQVWTTELTKLYLEPNEESSIFKTLNPGEIIIEEEIIDNNWTKVKFEENDYYVNTILSTEEYVPKKISLGYYTITHYCSCSQCCGAYSSGITATGAIATPGVTIAVDPKTIPYGSKIEINGHIYTAQDCGGGVKGNHIDVFVSSHAEALQKGTYTVEVFKMLN